MVFVELWNLAWHLTQLNAEHKQMSAHCDKKLLNDMRVSFAFKECARGSLSAFVGSINFYGKPNAHFKCDSSLWRFLFIKLFLSPFIDLLSFL